MWTTKMSSIKGTQTFDSTKFDVNPFVYFAANKHQAAF